MPVRTENWVPASGVPSSFVFRRRTGPRLGDDVSYPFKQPGKKYSLRDDICYKRAVLMYVEPGAVMTNSPSVFHRMMWRMNDPERTWSNKQTVEDVSAALADVVRELAYARGIGTRSEQLGNAWLRLAAVAENAAYMNSSGTLTLAVLQDKDRQCHAEAAEAASDSFSDAEQVERVYEELEDLRRRHTPEERKGILLSIAYLAQYAIRVNGPRSPNRGMLKFL